MNLNKFAKEVTLKEGKKVSLSIAQVKEVLRIVLEEFAVMEEKEVLKVIARYRAKKQTGGV